MDLQISVFLLFILFTAGHSLDCYVCSNSTGSCANQTVKTCPSGSSQCTSLVVGTQVEGVSSTGNSKDCASACLSQSFNFGFVRATSSCCGTDLCNAQDVPDPVPTGKKCYYCDDKTCSNTVSCSGTEDRCIKATASGGQTAVLKGCVSKSICDAPASVSSVGIGNFTCCEGNLCNGAQSVTQSFMFLCCSLLSFFLMH